MILGVDPLRARVLGLARLWLLLAVAVVVGHDAAYAVRFGVGPSLAQARSVTGHDAWWPLLAAAAGLALAVLLVASATTLVALERRGRSLPAADVVPRGPSWAAETITLWRRLGPLTVLAFFLQENVEALAQVGDIPGVAVLVAPAPLAVPSLLLITFALAAAGGLVRWRIGVLEARLTATATRRTRPPLRADTPPREWRRVSASAPHRWTLARLDAGRAPPSISGQRP